MTDFMKCARNHGWVPDWVWYQINEQTAQENWVEQRDKMSERLLEQRDTIEDVPNIFFTSETTIK